MADLLIDYEGALDRLGGDEEFLNELLHELKAQITENIADMEAKLADKDFEAIARLGHGLKGASANLDVHSIADLSRQLEQDAKDGDEAEIRSLIEKIKNTNKRLEEYLQEN